jgi:hypothetical protein
MKNWKTTLGGLLVGMAMLVGPRLQGDKTAAPVTAGNVLPAVAVAILGALSKDHDATGGTRQ